MNQLGYITDNMYLKMIINIKLKKNYLYTFHFPVCNFSGSLTL